MAGPVGDQRTTAAAGRSQPGRRQRARLADPGGVAATSRQPHRRFVRGRTVMAGPINARSHRSRGAALLLVLWLITLLTALVGGFALAARIEAMQGRVLVSGLVADNVARAGI